MSYKHIQRQFRRLPLPPPIVIDGSRVLKRDYKAGKSAVADLLALPHPRASQNSWTISTNTNQRGGTSL